MKRVTLASIVLLFGSLNGSPSAWAAGAGGTAILPPVAPFEGASRSIMVSSDDPWVTPSERTRLTATPSYAETVGWLDRLVAAAPELEMVSLGTSPEGRDIWMVVASADGAFSPAALRRAGKPILLAQAGIHSGEIDGKDAGLMLLRDLTVGGSKRSLLDRASFLFVPIFNVDGHERSSRFGRINQRGPIEMGWRTNARNLNLNRDYAKADTPEMQAMIRTLVTWQPDLYFDLHVTDGVDYQYDITFGFAGPQGYSPATAGWLETTLRPAVSRDLESQGHVPGPLVFAADGRTTEGGLLDWSASGPRYSDGYGGLRHLPTVLVENHSLKPYDQRVLGTYLLLASTLEVLGREGMSLRSATSADQARRPAEVPVAWSVPQDQPPSTVTFLGIGSRLESSVASGIEEVVWTGEPETVELQRFEPTVVTTSVARAQAYWVPASWPEVIERLALHGIEMERIARPRQFRAEVYQLDDPELQPQAFEGRARVTATPVPVLREVEYAAGSVRVPTDQPLGDLATILLEPTSADSFFQWGFFLEVLQRTEYVEGYVMAPMAEAMLRDDPALKAAFSDKLAHDKAFADDAQARLRWFYERTPFFDERWRLYPVARELAP